MTAGEPPEDQRDRGPVPGGPERRPAGRLTVGDEGPLKRERVARLARGALVSVALGLLACNGLTERRLRGTWEAEALPKRRLELAADGTYARRFTGNKLGLVSEVVGPERGQWRVEGGTLVLVRREAQRESIDRLEVRDLSPDHVVLAGEKWRRQSQPTPSASPSP